MREIGGYIELDEYYGNMFHDNAVALNCGRNALVYLLRAKKIKKIYIPKFLCNSVRNACQKEGVEISFYSVDTKFQPKELDIREDEWLYVVNYYGQLSNEAIKNLKKKYPKLIVDNAQAYFQMPVCEVDTLYTCRKYFGVPDGAFLYTDVTLDERLELDISFARMNYLHGRYERSASEFYQEYVANNRLFATEPLKQMSKLTRNLLHAINYQLVEEIRTNNFKVLDEKLGKNNLLRLSIPRGAFMYPFYHQRGAEIRKELQKKKIYIPMLWPDVFELCEEVSMEYDMAQNIVPIPVDQRYNEEDMLYIVEEIEKLIGCEGVTK